MATDVKILQNNDIAGLNFRVEGLELNCPPNAVSYVEKSWLYPVGIISVDFNSQSSHAEDVIDVFVAENSVISTTSASAAVGDNTLTLVGMTNMYGVSAKIGFNAKVTDGTNEDDLGEIIVSDSGTNTVTFTNPLVNNFASGSTFKVTIHSVKNYKIDAEGYHELFKNMITSYIVPPTINVKLQYTNHTSAKKKFMITMHYFY